MTIIKANVDPQIANSKGMAARQRGDFQAAAIHFAAAAAADPEASGLWRNLAHAHRELGNDEGERAALESALNADRTDLATWIRKAQLHERLAEHADAITAWGGVLQMSQAIHPIADALAPLLAHARAYCSEQQANLNNRVDAALGDHIAKLNPNDRRRVKGFFDHAMAGRRIYQNECAGLYYPFLPADEFFEDHHFSWFSGLTASTPAICKEFEALIADPGDALRPYVRQDKGTPDNLWSRLDNNLDWGAIFLWEYGEANKPILERCPQTAAALARLPAAHIPSRAPSAFFSVLKPHTHIPPHTGVTNTRAIIHLPLIIPDNCGFRVGGETREWQVGIPLAFDDTIEHEAWNQSDEYRVVLIFDVWNPYLSEKEQEMITHYFAILDQVGNSKTG